MNPTPPGFDNKSDIDSILTGKEIDPGNTL